MKRKGGSRSLLHSSSLNDPLERVEGGGKRMSGGGKIKGEEGRRGKSGGGGGE